MFFNMDISTIAACIACLILILNISFHMYAILPFLFASNCKNNTKKVIRKQTSCCCDPGSGLIFYCNVCESKKK